MPIIHNGAALHIRRVTMTAPLFGSVTLGGVANNEVASFSIKYSGNSNFVADAYLAIMQLPEYSEATLSTSDIALDFPGDGGAFVVPEQPSPLHVLDTSSGVWGIPLAVAKEAQTALLNAACKEAIYTGYSSDALGEQYHYPAKELDQSNMVASVTSSLYPGLPVDWATPFWCADVNGVWEYRMHSAAQIQKAGSDGKLAIIEALSKNAYLLQQVNQASTSEEVLQINW